MSTNSSSAARTTPPDASAQSARPELQEVVDRIGFGPAQIRFCLTGGGVYLADGAELLLITAVTKSVSVDWGLDAYERGLTVTIVFIGVLVGNFLCGPLGDAYGRRQLIVSSYVGIFVFSMLSSIAHGYTTFCALRLFVGLSFGIGQPAWNALCCEITPKYWRIMMNGLSMALFSAGEVYSAGLILADDPDLKSLHWRRLLQLGAIPSALFAIASSVFLFQSPSYLALHGHAEEAKAVLDVMKSDNLCDPSVSTDFEPAPPMRLSSREFGYQLKEIFNRTYRSSTLIVGLTCTGLNILYYGALYAFPQILPDLRGGGTAGFQLLIGSIWEVPGLFVGVVFGLCMPRKPVIKLYCITMVGALLAFVIGVRMQQSAFSHVLYHVGYYGIKASSSIGFVVSYQYAGEIYPTEIRSTGTSFCLGCGRLGAMLAPLLFEGCQDIFHNYFVFFYVLIAFEIFNCFLVDYLPFETANKLLSERLVPDDDTEAAESYGAVSAKQEEAAETVNPKPSCPDAPSEVQV